MTEFDKIRKDGRLLFEYIRGSHLYNLNTEDSDRDTGGIFIAPFEQLMGFSDLYKDQVKDERNDNDWLELGKMFEMLTTSNPTALEVLFVPRDKMLMEPSELLTPLFENRDMFVTKECFQPFVRYALEQISKARGLNKKIVNPMEKRLTAFDFTYTFFKQGSKKMELWLSERGLFKEHCGIVKIPNMHDTYGLYYDWGAHFIDKKVEYEHLSQCVYYLTSNRFERLKGAIRKVKFTHGASAVCKAVKFIMTTYNIYTQSQLKEWYDKNVEPKHYRGMCVEDSTAMRSSSVCKGEMPLCHFAYNQDGFVSHCKQWKEYKDWEANRNQKRYESNLDKNYDSKNMMHCVRLVHMGMEIALGEGVNPARTWDREFLLNIRNHKYEYDELMEKIDADKKKLEEAINNSTIPEKVDREALNSLLIELRKRAYNLI